jgi:hypothetical protein
MKENMAEFEKKAREGSQVMKNLVEEIKERKLLE